MKTRRLQYSFHAGEVDVARLRGRGDTPLYQAALSRSRNVLINSLGSARIRPGLRYVRRVPVDAKTILIPFPGPDADFLLVLSDERLDVLNVTNDTWVETDVDADWTEAQLQDLRWSQAFDTTLVAFGDVNLRLIRRTGVGDFAVEAFPVPTSPAEGTSHQILHRPFYRFQPVNMTLEPRQADGSALSSAPTADAAIRLRTSAAYWAAGHVGLRARYKGKQALITGFVSATDVEATVIEAFDGFAPEKDWDEQAWGALRGVPREVAFHNSRLVLASTASIPDGIWFSRIGDFYNFALNDGADDDAIWAEVGSREMTRISGLVSLERLVILSDSGAFITDEVVSPSRIMFKRQHSIGAATLMPQETDGAIIYMARDRRSVQEMVFRDDQQYWSSEPISLLASHLVTGVVRTAVAFSPFNFPDRYIFMLRDNGTLAVAHSNRAENVLGWGLWDPLLYGTWEDVATLRNQVYVIARRTGRDERFIARFDVVMTTDLGTPFTNAGSIQRDSFIGATDPPVRVLSAGKAHSSVAGDGSGVATFSETIASGQVGFGYGNDITTLPLDVVEPSPGRRRRTSRLVKVAPLLQSTHRLRLSVGLEVPGQDVGDPLLFQEPLFFDDLPDGKTGPHEQLVLGYKRGATVEFRGFSNQPVFWSVTGLELELSE